MSYKRLFKAIAARTPVVRALGNALNPGPTILMYHRFSMQPVGDGHTVDRDTCAWQFDRLRRTTTVWPLAAYFAAVRAGEKLPRDLVIITVDDGYRDFYEIAFPLLRENGLPATFFPVVEFVDGKRWLWPDLLRWMLAQGASRAYELDVPGAPVTVDLSAEKGRELAWSTLCRRCIERPAGDTARILDRVAETLSVAPPPQPPHEYFPCSWDELAEMAEAGIEIGSHSMTHPILSNVSPERLEWEVAEPMRAIRTRLGYEVTTFCYPNGQPNDVNGEVLSAVERAGYAGAVVTERNVPTFERFTTSRVGVSVDRNEFLWKSLGWEQSAARLRKMWRKVREGGRSERRSLD